MSALQPTDPSIKKMVTSDTTPNSDAVVVEVRNGEQVPLLSSKDNTVDSQITKTTTKCAQPRKRMVILIVLVVQAVVIPILIRWSVYKGPGVKPEKQKYLSPVPIFLSECMKFVFSIGLTMKDARLSPSRFTGLVRETFLSGLKNNILIAVLSALYFVQHNVLFVVVNCVSAATYQVVLQLRLMITAVLSVIILKKVVSKNRWVAIFLLTLGVALIEVPNKFESNEALSSSSTTTTSTTTTTTADSVSSVLASSHFLRALLLMVPPLTSGVSGVLLEFILKTSNVWARNIQLALFSIVLNGVFLFGWYYDKIAELGLLQGFTTLIWVITTIQAVHGLVVAAVLKHADILVKSVAQALAVAVTVLVSYLVFDDVNLTWFYLIGTSLVAVAIVVYSLDLPLFPNFLFSRRESKKAIDA